MCFSSGQMEEKDCDYFFGRTSGNRRGARGARRAGPAAGADRQFGRGQILRGAGRVLAALKRQAWPDDAQTSRPWPVVFRNSRQWCFLTLKPGAEPIKALVDCFLDAWQFSERGSGPRRGYREGGGRTGLSKVLRGGYCASGTRSNWRQERICCPRRARVQPTHCACPVSNDAHHLRLGGSSNYEYIRLENSLPRPARSRQDFSEHSKQRSRS